MTIRMTIARALVAVTVLGLGFPSTSAALQKSYIPLPEILTDPNEGNTYGFLGVVLFLDEQKIIKYILAPDVRYNHITGVDPTFRLFGYPSIARKWSVVLGKSEHIDEDYDLRYEDNGFWQNRARLFANFEFEQDSSERFFGFGNGSSQKAESNYTGRQLNALVWLAYRLQPTLSLTYRTRVRVFRVEKGGVDNLPSIEDEHPGTPGLGGATIVGQEFGLLYDTRDDTNIPRQGALGVFTAELVPRALGSSLSFVKYAAEGRKFIPIHDRIVLAMRARADYIAGPSDVPFFEQNDLGGHESLRGFGGGRFVDKDRVFASAELRTRVYRREIFGVNAELELAPFADFGQVFHSSRSSPFNDLHAVGGLGFRGVVPPQVVGFVDIGLGEQGLAAFTGLEYPF
ncbi:MAG: BamA/TamA family outer membrane protein [Deltaproteobacteria bacterium]|nr:BamA/TamA family outer membrane protein [Deltaproteobacteria bacterium]